MKILLTGTHFTPAQALIERLNKLGAFEIVYLGRASTQETYKGASAESKVLPELGVRFIPIVSGRFSRNLSFRTLIALLKLPIGLAQSLWFVFKEQPDVVVSFGGYIGFPVIFWSWWFNFPVVIHEQTLKLGLANWLSLPFASKVCLAFPIERYKKNSKVVVTGNPIRSSLFEEKTSKELDAFFRSNRELPLLLVAGGNQGSHFINRLIGRNLAELVKHYSIIHQTGENEFKDFEYLQEEAAKLSDPKRYLAAKWFEAQELSAIIRKTTLVISRAGMNTLYELALFGKMAFLIPIPFSVQPEQLQNARFFQKLGLGDYLNQESVSDQVFLHHLVSVIKKAETFVPDEKSKQVFLENGADRLAQEVLSYE